MFATESQEKWGGGDYKHSSHVTKTSLVSGTERANNTT